jgi:hypothetical protein
MKPIIKIAKKKAQARLSELENGPYYDQASRLIQEAGDRWGAAEGLEDGCPGLRRYLAVSTWPADMAYIPKGNVTARLNGRVAQYSAPAFFIDIREASASAFNFFCKEYKWRIPNGLAQGDHSATNVTYYDALAFLTTHAPVK